MSLQTHLSPPMLWQNAAWHTCRIIGGKNDAILEGTYARNLLPGIADRSVPDEKKHFLASYHYVAKDNNTNGYESIPGVQYHLKY